VRRWIRSWAEEDTSLQRVALVFDTPVAPAALLALMASRWFYPQAPRLLWAVIVAAALVPTVLILRRVLHRGLLPVLYALVACYVLDQLRGVWAAQPLLARVLLMAEMLGGAAFLAWLVRSGRLAAAVGTRRNRLGGAVRAAARVGVIVLVAAFAAAALGYVTLANLLGNATLGSARLALILYAATRVIDGLTMSALRSRPLVLLAMVRQHRNLFWHRARRIFQWAAAVWWAVMTLDMLSVRGWVVETATRVLTTPLTIGAFSLSLGQVIAFVLTVWAAFLVSRFVRFLLEEDVYPRLHLARGLPHAISTTLHYAILVVGFVAAVGMLGYDLTKFTILAGAFGVGLGFGLQNIFNNFISGLILLFERPIKVGDVVQIGADVGVVRRIGIRASIVRLPSGAEIIMPNGKLISDPVTNWTRSNRQRRIELTVSVAQGTDPGRVLELWSRTAAADPRVAKDPPPRALLTGFGAALTFDLHAWVTDFDEWTQTRSDLAVAINAALTDAGIAVR
jgi:small-conductance mechanosensitive channel